MTVQALKAWLNTAITGSLTAVPGSPSYPYQSSVGVLNAKGFTTSNTLVYQTKPSPIVNVNAGHNFVVIINNPSWNSSPRFSGSSNDLQRLHTIRLDVVWIAEFIDIGGTPDYTDELVSNKQFTKFVEALERTLERANSKIEVSGGEVIPYHYEITDATTSEVSCIKNNRYPVIVQNYDPDPREEGQNLLYGATISCQFLEEVNI